MNVSGQIKYKNCNEFIFFVGIGNPEELISYDSKRQDIDFTYAIRFTPKYIHPPINIFEIPDGCPALVKNEIKDSFKLYWVDLDSCANKLRIALEALMDELKLRKYRNANGKRISISLHKRIEEFKNKEIQDILLAIKWIGNSGSHSSQKLETIDVIETYKLLEFSLQKLFNNNEIEIKAIAKEINQRKGLRKRK